MFEYKEKFIVINTKRFDELFDELGNTTDNPVFDLVEAIQTFQLKYKEVMNKEMNQKYYVCNQDEPYAKKVIDTILKGEDKKEIKDLSISDAALNKLKRRSRGKRSWTYNPRN